MNLGGLLGALVIGGLAGWVASMIMKTDASMGVFANIIVGIIGAILGNLVLGLFNVTGTTGFSVWSFVVALIGAVILLWIIKMVRGRSAV